MSKVFPDTSFLISLYQVRPSSGVAAQVFESLADPLPITDLLRLEFENALRLAAFHQSKGMPNQPSTQQVMVSLARFEADLEAGRLELLAVSHEEVIRVARRLSDSHTWQSGCRMLDLLHLASAQVLKATRFLTFDRLQEQIAQREGLDTVL